MSHDRSAFVLPLRAHGGWTGEMGAGREARARGSHRPPEARQRREHSGILSFTGKPVAAFGASIVADKPPLPPSPLPPTPCALLLGPALPL